MLKEEYWEELPYDSEITQIAALTKEALSPAPTGASNALSVLIARKGRKRCKE